MNKKIFLVCALLIMSIFVFAACSNKDDGKVTTTTTTAATSTTESVAKDAKNRMESKMTEYENDITTMLP
ncbi:MAG: hypothetical protein RR985_02125 [Oscillospiraceae bacterium]